MMCGLARPFNVDSRQAVDAGVLEAMTDAVRHRGPDPAGYSLDGAVGLGHRRPSIIHRLLEFDARVPSALKLRQGRSKYLLRRALERRVPQSILERGKRGFEAPNAEWLRGPLRDMTSELLCDERLRGRGIFDPAEITRRWNEHRSARSDHRHRIWQLVMLELWFRQFIDGGAARAPARQGDTARSAMAAGGAR